MGVQTSNVELTERLKLIESMMAEGQQRTARWGWTFVLWGVAYLVATAWSSGLVGGPVWAQHLLAWPVTMIAASIATGVTVSRMKKGEPATMLGRAIGAAWAAMGISLFVVLMSLGVSGRYDLHVFVAIIGGMLAVANMTSAIILKWKMQFACAVVWLASAVVACFGTVNQAGIAFLAATFFCQIVFGIYAMILESRRRKQRIEVVNA
jgi:peptidoglycan/LPS O-acetylase OafA/YrhL